MMTTTASPHRRRFVYSTILIHLLLMHDEYILDHDYDSLHHRYRLYRPQAAHADCAWYVVICAHDGASTNIPLTLY